MRIFERASNRRKVMICVCQRMCVHVPRAIFQKKKDPCLEVKEAGKGKSETECCEKDEQIDPRRRRSNYLKGYQILDLFDK